MFDKTILILLMIPGLNLQEQMASKSINKNGMTVSWSFNDERICFEMTAPTKGWIAIGFNESHELTNTYLIMGVVNNGKTTVKEHHVFEPGDYQSFVAIDEPESIYNVSGQQTNTQTTIKFTLPISSFFQYTKQLKQGAAFNMLLAYSLEKDFQHHSIMRTSINVKL